jgi:DNA-binding phage protein
MGTKIEGNEDVLEYVIRHLKNPAFNTMQIVRQTQLSRTSLHNIASRKTDPLYSNVMKIYGYFKALENRK